MVTEDMVRGLAKIEAAIEKEKGPLTLFAIIKNQEGLEKWDLVISSRWTKSTLDNVHYVVGKLREGLSGDELVLISRVVPLKTDDRFVVALNRAVRVERGSVRVSNSNLFGFEIVDAYVITSKILAVNNDTETQAVL
jgi:hypothetical protein